MLDRLLSELRYRWRSIAQRDRVERELDAEMSFHLDQEARKLEASGLSAPDAMRAARVAFGGVERIKEEARAMRGVTQLEQWWADLRHAARGLRARPAFALGVAGTLALGFGANAAMFGIVDRLMFRTPSGLRQPDRVHRVHLRWVQDGEPRSDRAMQFPRFRDFARETRSFDRVGAFQVRTVALGTGEETIERRVAVVSAGFIELFEAPAALGRWFTAAEDEPPAGASVVVLSHAYWRTRYGGRNDILGQRLQVDRLDAEIVGVAPPGFVGIADEGAPVAFVPMSAFAHAIRGAGYVSSYNWGWLELAVRRREGVSIQESTADLTNAFRTSWRAEDAARGQPTDFASWQPSAALGPVHLARGPDAGLDARVTLWIAGVAMIVLLIACANVTNLFLSRAVSRQREIAMRLALGVGRRRLTRQLLMESLLLGLLGGTGGMVLARLAGGALRALLLPDADATAVITDPRTLGYALLLALGVGALTAVVPATIATRLDVAAALKAGGRSASRKRSRLQASLVVVQAALSALLLVGAALFVRSLQRAREHRLGFDVDRLLYAEVNLRGTQLNETDMRQLGARIEETARAVPGVRFVAMTASVPFWSNEGRDLIVPGVDSIRRLGRFTLQAGGGEYFAATGTRIVAGRPFTALDREGTLPVAVVSEGMARAVWPGRQALGQCFRVDDPGGPCRTVIGVAEEQAMRALEPTREFTYYLPVAQFPEAASPQFFLRVDDGRSAPLSAARSRLQSLMPGAAYVSVVPLAELVTPQYRGWRFGATMFVAFGGLALVLAALGLHGLVAYDVAQRQKEIGVRLALGASRDRLLRLVVGQGARLAALGVGIGLLLALALSRPVGALLFHQSPRDPLVFVAIGGALLLVAIVASALPAWRAARTDPCVALRAD